MFNREYSIPSVSPKLQARAGSVSLKNDLRPVSGNVDGKNLKSEKKEKDGKCCK